jgi:hypothetical protein
LRHADPVTANVPGLSGTVGERFHQIWAGLDDAVGKRAGDGRPSCAACRQWRRIRALVPNASRRASAIVFANASAQERVVAIGVNARAPVDTGFGTPSIERAENQADGSVLQIDVGELDYVNAT